MESNQSWDVQIVYRSPNLPPEMTAEMPFIRGLIDGSMFYLRCRTGKVLGSVRRRRSLLLVAIGCCIELPAVDVMVLNATERLVRIKMLEPPLVTLS